MIRERRSDRWRIYDIMHKTHIKYRSQLSDFDCVPIRLTDLAYKFQKIHGKIGRKNNVTLQGVHLNLKRSEPEWVKKTKEGLILFDKQGIPLENPILSDRGSFWALSHHAMNHYKKYRIWASPKLIYEVLCEKNKIPIEEPHPTGRDIPNEIIEDQDRTLKMLNRFDIGNTYVGDIIVKHFRFVRNKIERLKEK